MEKMHLWRDIVNPNVQQHVMNKYKSKIGESMFNDNRKTFVDGKGVEWTLVEKKIISNPAIPVTSAGTIIPTPKAPAVLPPSTPAPSEPSKTVLTS